MPSSMRPTSTISGVRVVSARYPKIAKSESEGDRNAGEDAEAGHADKEDDQIDIAERTQPRLRQPENRHQQTQPRAPRPATILTSPVRASRRNANSAIRPTPTGSAAARQMLAICSAGVVMKLSS